MEKYKKLWIIINKYHILKIDHLMPNDIILVIKSKRFRMEYKN